MTTNGTEAIIEEMELFVRYFLVCYNEFNTSINPVKNKGWVTSYNFLSLLNLPSALRTYGNMRVLWEGGDDGEGYLWNVKPLLRGGLVRQWQVWLMNNLLEDKTFNSIISNEILYNNATRSELNEFKVYGSKKKIIEAYKKCQTLSGFVRRSDNKKIYIAYTCKGKVFGVTVKVNIKKRVFRNHMVYQRIEIMTNKTILINNDEQSNQSNHMGILLLPMFPLDYVENKYPVECIDSNSVIYTIIAPDWSYIY